MESPKVQSRLAIGRNECSAIKPKKGKQPKSDPRLAPPPLPLAWAFRPRGKGPTAKRGKPQFGQGRGRRKHMRSQRRMHHQAVKASPKGGG